jgi:hypothetical protein
MVYPVSLSGNNLNRLPDKHIILSEGECYRALHFDLNKGQLAFDWSFERLSKTLNFMASLHVMCH